ncbi:MAG TPA: cell wall-binding repeat-containing protein, partial [Egibacteraceae bacterium]|nr:cell wall-binding repeat-containing protein [Egibacteraceae bacterium]
MSSFANLRRRVGIMVALSVVASLLAAPASAIEESPAVEETAGREAVEGKARALAEQLVKRIEADPTAAKLRNRSFAAVSGSDGCFEDAQGDTFVDDFGNFFVPASDLGTFYDDFETATATAQNHPAADIKQFCADFQATELALTMRVKAPVAPVDDLNLSYRIWLVDTTGAGTADTYVFHVSLLGFQFAFVLGGTDEDPVDCDAVADFDGTSFSASRIPLGCLGDAEQIMIAAMTLDVPDLAEELEFFAIEDLDAFYDLAPSGSQYRGALARPERTGDRPKDRLADADRIGTAIRISQHQFPEAGSAVEVYLARADNYPDALAGGSLGLGPILLVPSCGAGPQAVLDELDRLDPIAVIALGGENAICDQVVLDAAGGRDARRVSGATRIETAAMIAEEAWGVSEEVYLARADNFPDALAGGILKRGPILLVPTCGDLPTAVADAIALLDPDRVIALGGTAAICDSMLEQAGAGRAIDRYAGPTRFHTAVEISKAAFPFGAVEVYLARADNFPDALAGGILTLGPILLVPTCGDLPQEVADEIARLNPTSVLA